MNPNAPRWDGARRGMYEVWYLTMSDPDSGRGFWFRYTLEVPKDREAEPVPELWGFAFEPGRPAVGGKARVPLRWPPEGLEDRRARGELPGIGLGWDVTWEPAGEPLWHIPGPIGRSGLPRTTVVSPAVDAVFSGMVRVGDEEVELRAARGCQTHLWGRRHADRWAWGHCSAFDGADGVVLEAIRASGVTLLYVEAGGEKLRCNPLWSRSRVEGHRWEMWGRAGDVAVRAVLEGTPSEMAQVTYEDPDGAKAYCANTEVARCVLEVGDERYESAGLAHVELGSRTPDPEVPVLC